MIATSQDQRDIAMEVYAAFQANNVPRKTRDLIAWGVAAGQRGGIPDFGFINSSHYRIGENVITDWIKDDDKRNTLDLVTQGVALGQQATIDENVALLKDGNARYSAGQADEIAARATETR